MKNKKITIVLSPDQQKTIKQYLCYIYDQHEIDESEIRDELQYKINQHINMMYKANQNAVKKQLYNSKNIKL